MAVGLATPLPAMSCALPCATEANRIGRADGQRRGGVPRQQLGGDVALVVQHDDEGVDARHVKHGVGAERAADGDPRGDRGLDRRLDDVDLLAPEQPAFAGMRVETADGDLRAVDAHPRSVRSAALITRLTFSRVIIAIAFRTLRCSVAWTIFMSPKHSIR